eukprot:3407116-Rhodomonas_salina.1
MGMNLKGSTEPLEAQRSVQRSLLKLNGQDSSDVIIRDCLTQAPRWSRTRGVVRFVFRQVQPRGRERRILKESERVRARQSTRGQTDRDGGTKTDAEIQGGRASLEENKRASMARERTRMDRERRVTHSKLLVLRLLKLQRSTLNSGHQYCLFCHPPPNIETSEL